MVLFGHSKERKKATIEHAGVYDCKIVEVSKVFQTTDFYATADADGNKPLTEKMVISAEISKNGETVMLDGEPHIVSMFVKAIVVERSNLGQILALAGTFEKYNGLEKTIRALAAEGNMEEANKMFHEYVEGSILNRTGLCKVINTKQALVNYAKIGEFLEFNVGFEKAEKKTLDEKPIATVSRSKPVLDANPVVTTASTMEGLQAKTQATLTGEKSKTDDKPEADKKWKELHEDRKMAVLVYIKTKSETNEDKSTGFEDIKDHFSKGKVKMSLKEVETVMSDLLSDGEIFEPRTGRYKELKV